MSKLRIEKRRLFRLSVWPNRITKAIKRGKQEVKIKKGNMSNEAETDLKMLPYYTSEDGERA